MGILAESNFKSSDMLPEAKPDENKIERIHIKSFSTQPEINKNSHLMMLVIDVCSNKYFKIYFDS